MGVSAQEPKRSANVTAFEAGFSVGRFRLNRSVVRARAVIASGSEATQRRYGLEPRAALDCFASLARTGGSGRRLVFRRPS